MDSAFAAARLGDPIAHSSAMMGFLVGALVGAVVGIAIVAATVATGGAALAVVAAVGGAVAATGGGALAGMSIGQEYTTVTGAISTGAFTVFINNKPAARATSAPGTLDVAACSDHQSPQFLAEGSRTVFIEMGAASRKGDRTVCDAKISEGSPDVFIGADPGQYREISPEVPAVLQNIALGMVVVGTAVALLAGGAAAFAAGGWCALGTFGLETALGAAGGWGGSKLGAAIGEALGGAKGKAWGEAIGGVLGGIAGGYAGNKLGGRVFQGHPVDVATGELVTQETDFELPGPLPLRWSRLWISSSTIDGELGRGWHHPLDMALIPPGGDRSLFILRHADGRYVPFDPPRAGRPSLNTSERLLLHTDGVRFWVTNYSGMQFEFAGGANGRPSRLVRIADANDNAITVDRDADGRLRRIRDSGGRTLDVETDAAGRITAISGPAPSGVGAQQLVAYRYDGEGCLREARRAGGSSFSYYHRNGLLVRETRPGGLSFHFEWDDLVRGTGARCVKTWGDGDLYHRRFDYDPAAGRTLVRGGRGDIVEYHWNELGLVTLEVDAVGGRTTRSYDEAGRLRLAVDPCGGRSSWTYDDLGRLVEATDPAGGVIRLRYASEGRQALAQPGLGDPVEVEEPGGVRHLFTYDGRGNLTRYVDPAGRERRYMRDLRGLTLAIMDEIGILGRFGWTEAGCLAWEATERGARTRFSYDSLGRVTAGQVVGHGVTRLLRDEAGRVTEIERPDGGRIVLSYDAEGHVVRHRDGAGRETAWDYGGLPTPIKRVNPDGTSVAYRYDGDLNLVELINAKGESYRLDYDAAGRLVREIGFDGREQRYAYDAAGRLVRYEDAGLRVTTYHRDPLGRLLEKYLQNGSVHRFGYDAAGRLCRADNPVRSLGFVYNPAGDLLEEHQDEHVLRHAYDARGRRVSTRLPDGREIAVGYDDVGRFDHIGFAGRTVLRLRRDAAGREVERQTGSLRALSEYDPQGRLTRQTAWRESEAAKPVLGRWYRYDAADQVVSIGDWCRGVRNYRYDPCEHLIHITGDQPEDFVVDPAGNILASEEGGGALGGSARGDRLLVHGDRHFEYDASGNRVRETRGAGGGVEVLYGYGPTNQLEVVREASRLGRRETLFGYDALGRRAWKEARFWGQTPANTPRADQPLLTTSKTTFLWNGDVPLAEATSVTGEGPSDPWAVVYLFEPGTFKPVAQVRRDAADRPGAVYHYHCDHIGTPQELTDDQGAIVWQARMKAWGSLAEMLVETVPNPLRFQGQYHDVETGLHYNRFRYYAPEQGCFIQRDPIGLRGGTNVAAYAANPVNWVDPFGLSCTDPVPPEAAKPKDEYVDILSPEARQHILYGDGPGSGGHMWPGQPGKSTFPQDWSGDKIIHNIGDITTSPSTQWYAQTGTGGPYTKAGDPARWVAYETRDGVRIRVVYEPATGKVITGFPDPNPVPPAYRPIPRG